MVSPSLRRNRSRAQGSGDEVKARSEDIDWCYRLLLDREPDQHGKEGFQALLAGTGISRQELVGYFISSPEFRNRLVTSFGWSEGAPQPVKVGDITYYVSDDDSSVGASLRKTGEYEPAVTAMVRRHLREGQTFVDVGAAFGYFSVLAGTIVGPSGLVVAFEPGPQNQSVLILNLEMNGVRSAEVHQVALSDGPGVFMYSHSGANGFISPFTGVPEDLASHSLVQATTLDRLLGERSVDMMKIDVEGAEGLVLAGGRSTLERSHPMLLIEFSPPSLLNTSHLSGEAFLGLLTEHGYSIQVVDSDATELTPRSVDEVMSAFGATNADHIDIVAWQ